MTSGSCMVGVVEKVLVLKGSACDNKLAAKLPLRNKRLTVLRSPKHTADIWPQLTADPNSPLVVRKSAPKV